MNILLTCMGLVLLQILLARSFGGRISRWVAWLGVIAAFYIMHLIAIESPSLIRMLTLCTVLLAGMKWIVYREWSAKKKRNLSWQRWWIFSTMWFGMDPGCFAGKRRICAWRSHVITGASCILIGGVLWYACYHFQFRNVILLVIPMSMVIHFGVLRLLTGFWRMQGFPVRTLFRNPLEIRGFRDFWSRRWNLAYSEMMAITVKQPLRPILGEKGSTFAVFFISGLIHELAITVPVQAGYGIPTLIFVIHGICTVYEKKNSTISAVFCAILLIAGIPYLFNEKFQTEVIIPSRDVFNLIEKNHMKKTIVIAGANGFTGKYLSEYYLKKGWIVKAIARRTEGLAKGVEFHQWDGENLGAWKSALEGATAVVNLAGRTVNCRYTDENKRQILDSRVNCTSAIGEAIRQSENPPEVWLNASTATIFRDASDHYQTESEGDIGEGFSVDVAKAWEAALNDAEVDPSVRKIALRISLVMADEPGTVLEIFRGLAKKWLGGPMGNGKQMVSWIHIDDWCRAIDWMIETPEAQGAYNLATPNAINNADMMKLIRKDVGRSFGLPAYEWMLEIGAFFMRTETELIVKSRWVYPEKLLEEGFEFEKPKFEDILNL